MRHSSGNDGSCCPRRITANWSEPMKGVKKKQHWAGSLARRNGRRSSASPDADQAKLAVDEYCVFHYPTLFTAGVPRSSTWKGQAAWTIPIVLTHPELGVIGEAGEAI